MLAVLAWGILFLLPLVGANPAGAMASFSQIIAFGDSYSDSGNVGRTTEAENWLELLAADLDVDAGLRASSAGGSNFSMGTATVLGSGPLDLSTQLNRFVRSNSAADPDALYVLWAGFNDIQQSEGVQDLQLFADQVVDGIQASMQRIQQVGGRHFLIPNAWDITTTPVALFRDDERNHEHAEIHQLFNSSLSTMLETFSAETYELDVFGLSREIFDEPTAFGFADRHGICPSDTTRCDGFVWRDLIHPTSVTHRILADRAIAAIPEPSTALLLAFGLILLRSSLGERAR